MPVGKPIPFNMKTKSSVARLPAAPGANGQPPNPPAELSKTLTPNSSERSALASCGSPRVVKMAGRFIYSEQPQRRFHDLIHLMGSGNPNRVADGDLVYAD